MQPTTPTPGAVIAAGAIYSCLFLPSSCLPTVQQCLLCTFPALLVHVHIVTVLEGCYSLATAVLDIFRGGDHAPGG